jgi:DNA helicase-2/ATP-dependent DNA helicase PcrA
MRRVFREIGISPQGDLTVPMAARYISEIKNDLLDPEEMVDSGEHPAWCDGLLLQIYQRYENALTECGGLDFDDLLQKSARLLEQQESVRLRYQSRFQFLLIDEYQDTNTAQYSLARSLALEHENIFVAGDPDQSIYSWRGARPHNLLRFEEDFHNPTLYPLEQNYRSTQTILRAANELVTHNSLRKELTLWTENPTGSAIEHLINDDDYEEARLIARRISSQIDEGIYPGDIAVFYRINSLSRKIEEALARAGIPHAVIGSIGFYHRREIKDLMAYLHIKHNPYDWENFERAATTPKRGIGPKALSTIHRLSREQMVSPIQLVLEASHSGSLPGVQRKALKELAKILEWVSLTPAEPIAPWIEELLEKTDYLTYLDRTAAHSEDQIQRRANVAELLDAANQHDADPTQGKKIDLFLERASLASANDRSTSTGIVSLMSLHAAKGLEFPHVTICALEDGILPISGREDSPDEYEEERRLFYVGITRAQKTLTLTSARSRTRAGSFRTSFESPFLDELPAETLGRQDSNPDRPHWDVTDDIIDDLDLPVFEPGDRVRHPSLGSGEILSISRFGHRTHVRVAFDQEGIKKILLEYATLEHST